MSSFRAKSIIRRGFVRGLVGAGVTLVAVSMAATPVFAWVGGPGLLNVTQTWDGAHVPTLDVEGSDSIENVKQKIQDKTGMNPAEMCLTFGVGTVQVVLQDGRMISDYPDINPGDLLELWRIPVTAAWSITPDEPYLGGTVSNAIITHPSVTHAEVVAGSLPAGVTLNETTGQVDGTFAQPGAFDVTIAADTLCGSSELTWSGTVSGSASNALPETGRNVENFAAVLGIGALSFIAGLFITAIRWRRKAPHTL